MSPIAGLYVFFIVFGMVMLVVQLCNAALKLCEINSRLVRITQQHQRCLL